MEERKRLLRIIKESVLSEEYSCGGYTKSLYELWNLSGKQPPKKLTFAEVIRQAQKQFAQPPPPVRSHVQAEDADEDQEGAE